MRLEEVLQEMRESGINFEIIEHKSVLRCTDVTRELGVPLERIIKTLILKSGDRFIGLVTLGSSRVDLELLSKFTGMRLSLCPKELVENVTGLELGGITPILLEMDLILDERIASDEVFLCGTGKKTSSMAISGRDLFNFLVKKRRCITVNLGGDFCGCGEQDGTRKES